MTSSGLVQASKRMRAGALKVRVTTNSRSDVRSAVVGLIPEPRSLFTFASIDLLLLFHFLDDIVQRLEPCGPELPVSLDPGRLVRQLARAQPAGPHAANLLGG